MNIGYVNIFSFRPHVHHLAFLAKVLRGFGCKAYSLSCDSSVRFCYARLIKGTKRIIECPKCMVGGVRSYPVGPAATIHSGTGTLNQEILDQLALSSSCTLHRTETDAEWFDPEVVATRKSLYAPISHTYHSTLAWIERYRIDAVICFNGRMDLTRAVLYACEQARVPFVTHERSWFGDGLHLVPNGNCLSLKAIHAMVRDFQDRPLLPAQANLAGKLVAERFLQQNALEWRLYNQNPEPASWPLRSDGQRVLVLPSSRNEFGGHPEWQSGWSDNTRALDDLFARFGITPKQVVVRCHPNWAEKIGQVDGRRSLQVYADWTRRRGIHSIFSDQKDSTYDLIQQADMVVMNGGSSAVEAGACGKQVVCLGPSGYQYAGFVQTFCGPEDLAAAEGLDPIDVETVIRKTLRYLYLRARRFPQYIDYVRALETTRYEYFEGADPERILSMLRTGTVLADDPSFAETSAEEDAVVDALRQKKWHELAGFIPLRKTLPPLKVERRVGLRWLDWARSKFPRGDRG